VLKALSQNTLKKAMTTKKVTWTIQKQQHIGKHWKLKTKIQEWGPQKNPKNLPKKNILSQESKKKKDRHKLQQPP